MSTNSEENAVRALNGVPARRPKTKFCTRSKVLTTVFVVLSTAAAAATILFITLTKKVPSDPETPPFPSYSILRKFKEAAVCADAVVCSKIGRDILKKNGSAVDAAIATSICNGIVNCQSMGLGGGFLMTTYIRANKTAYSLNAREAAPLAVDEKLYTDKEKPKTGPLAVAVPGELAGYWEAHKRFGKLKWSELVEPSFQVCEEGYEMTLHQSDSIRFRSQVIRHDPILSKWFMDPNTGSFYAVGHTIIQTHMCKTLKIIAEKGGDVLYNGTLAESFVDDIKELGGIITLQDMKEYRALWDQPVEQKLRDGVTVYSAPPPGSGILLSLILNILDGYNFNPKSISTLRETVRTFHRIAEAFKFSAAKRNQLGDPKFVDIKKLLETATKKSYGEELRAKIDDKKIFDSDYYGDVTINKDEHGTAHVSVLAPNGDAVSLTSTINLYFGAGMTSKSTGIVLNSGMDDFSFRAFPNYFGLPANKNNFVAPKKRSVSSMAPAILVDSNGDVRMVVGASGGSKIITAVSYVIMRNLWFGENIKEAVDARRIHHQLTPYLFGYEYGVIGPIVNGLRKIGHQMDRFDSRSSVVCAISKENGHIFANADFRKGGDVHGF